MKRYIADFVLVLLFSAAAWGQQSACQTLGVNCRDHGQSAPPRERQQQPRQDSDKDDNLSTPSTRAEDQIQKSLVNRDAFVATHQSYYFDAAKQELDEALRIKPNDGRALYMMVKLFVARGTNPLEIYKVAVRARDHADFSDYAYNRKLLHQWFTTVAADEYVAYLEEYQAQYCDVLTSPSEPNAVDPSVDVGNRLQECRKTVKMHEEAVKDRNKEDAKFNKINN